MKNKYNDIPVINNSLSKILRNKREVSEQDAYEYVLEGKYPLNKYSLNDVTCKLDECLVMNIAPVAVIKYINQKNNRQYFVYSNHNTVKYYI